MSAQMAFVTTGISGASSDTSCWLVTLSYTKQGQKNLISLERPKAPQRAKIQGMTHQPAFFWVCLYVYVCVCAFEHASVSCTCRTCIPWGRPFACRLSVDGLDAGIGREDIQKRGMPVAGCSDNII